MIIFLVLAVFVGLAIWAIVKSTKAMGNTKIILDANGFKQAGIEVTFSSGNLKIKSHNYHVNQVTGLSTEPFTSSHKHGASRAYRAIIQVDDFAKPIHKVDFMSRKKAEEFVQRFSVALRKAGGPSFN